MKTEILSIGTELLLGDILNTNSHFLSVELAKLGIPVFHHNSVGDNAERLSQVLKTAFERSDIVITSGGLGPTADDITKQVAAEFFNRPFVTHEESRKRILEFFKARGIYIDPIDMHRFDVKVPEGSIVLQNNNGLAPGCIIEENDKILILLPGPPKEMESMFLDSVKPYLRKKSNQVYVSKTLHLAGISENIAENMIADLIESQTNPTIAPYAKTSGGVVFRITASAKTEEEAMALIEPVKAQLYERLGDNIFGEDDIPLEKVVVDMLVKRGLTISCAESCTGGMVASKLVNIPNVSKVFKEAIVAYSYDAKIERLGVSKEDLRNLGAVSEKIAEQMAIGAAQRGGADIGISTTGIAGPGNGNGAKPVGLVYIGIYINGKVTVKEINCIGDRQRVRNFATSYALDALRRELIKQ